MRKLIMLCLARRAMYVCVLVGLGAKDHATWQGGEKDMMADWLLDRTPSTSWIEEVRTLGVVMTNRSQQTEFYY